MSVLWVIGMIVFASWTVQRRAPGVPGAMRIAALAFGTAALATLGVLFGLRVFELSGRTLVPLAGMMIGNSLSATVLAAKRLVTEADEHRDLIEARLALGQPATQAFAPHLRATLRTALIYLVLVAVAVTTTVTSIGVSRRLFTPDQRLARQPSAV